MNTPRHLRVVFLGNDDWSVPSLEAVAGSSHHLERVVTRVPRPKRRGRATEATPVATAARRLRLPLVESETVRSGKGFEAIADAAPDVIAVVAFGEILPPSVLALPSVAPVNVHFSLLPALRGASPVQTALLRGLSETGVTTIVMDEGVDTGDILRREREAILPDDDAGMLGGRLARLGGRVLVETLDELRTGGAARIAQDDGAATYAPKLSPSDRRLDFSAAAAALAATVRAFAPEPGATATFRGSPLKIVRARAVEASGPPGEVIEVDREGFSVGAGVGALRIVEVAPAGRARMPASDFVNGFRPVVGERLS
jgi:methionyl-tRNA formyltransferase